MVKLNLPKIKKVENSREFLRELENSGIPGDSRSGIPLGILGGLDLIFTSLYLYVCVEILWLK